MKFDPIKFITTLLTLMFITSSCSDKDEPSVPEKDAARTILIYMAANNSLADYACDTKDIEEIRSAARSGALGKDGRLILFHAPRDGSRTLYEVTNSGELKVLKTYPGGTNATDFVVSADFMVSVFNDAKAIAPAKDYGLIMWSHAFGWTQNGLPDDGPTITPKTWGDDKGRSMNITTLAKVLKVSPWSWVYFDCCFMGSVEVAYQLAPVLPRMVASATEVPLDGMPYDKNLPLLFLPQADLTGAARNTFEYYDALHGEDRTVSVSVFELEGMAELAEATRAVYETSSVFEVYDFYNLPLEESFNPRFYDLGVYVEGMCKANGLQSLYPMWQQAYKKVVVYEAATPMLWDAIDLSDFTGMSTYIPRNISDMSYRGYNTLLWYEDVAKYLYDKQ